MCRLCSYGVVSGSIELIRIRMSRFGGIVLINWLLVSSRMIVINMSRELLCI